MEKEGQIKGRERFGGYSHEFIVKTLDHYKKIGDEAFEKGDLSLYFSTNRMSLDFINAVLNRKTSN